LSVSDSVVRIDCGRFTLEGRSRAGNETFFRVKELGLALDIGRCPDFLIGVPDIFVTHSHLDHSLGIPFYAAQRLLQKLPTGHVYVPQENVSDYRELMKIHERLEGVAYPLDLIGLKPGDELSLRRDLKIRVHRSTHRVVANAYEVVGSSARLDEKFAGIAPDRLASLRNAGETLTTEVETSLLFYTGDTDSRILDENEHLYRTRVLVIECSFTGEGERERGRLYTHIHLDDLIDVAKRFENELIVLTHFSLRDSPASIHERIRRRVPDFLRSRMRLALPPPHDQIM